MLTNKDPCFPLQVTVVGDNHVGKTSLILSYTTKDLPSTYVPTVFQNYTCNERVDGIAFDLDIFESGHDEKLQSLCYPDTDVFLIVFSVVNLLFTMFKSSGLWISEECEYFQCSPFGCG